jgi:hypothetical protein
MHTLLTVVGSVTLISWLIYVVRYVTHDRGQHADKPRTALASESEPEVSDDTQQMSSTDRRDALQPANTEPEPMPSMIDIWAETAQWQALINSGQLASTPWVPRRVTA